MNICARIQRHSAEFPDRPALQSGTQILSWAALAAAIERAGACLIRQGIVSGHLVGICMRNEITAVVTLLALARLGAIYFALDWRQRLAERTDLIAAVAPSMILYDFQPAATHASARILSRNYWENVAAPSDLAPTPDDPASPACLILSSGTTNRPKAVVLDRQRQASRTIMRARTDGITVGMRVMQTMPIWTSAGVSGLLAQLYAGAETHFSGLLFTASSLIESLQRLQINQVTLVPTVLRDMLKLAEGRRLELPAIRALISLGSAFHPDEKRQALECVSPHIYERYGSAGTGVISRATPADILQAPNSVGHPPDFVRVEIVDDSDTPLPTGAVGRIRVASPGNANGYWRETGRSDRFELFAGGYVYPGDLGRLDTQQRLYLEGRGSAAIVTGGLKLHPEEIERVLARHPQIADSAVFGIEEPRLGETPVALVVPIGQPVVGDILALCRMHLQPHKVPTSIRFVAALPRTAAGKLHRAGLAQFWNQAK